MCPLQLVLLGRFSNKRLHKPTAHVVLARSGSCARIAAAVPEELELVEVTNQTPSSSNSSNSSTPQRDVSTEG